MAERVQARSKADEKLLQRRRQVLGPVSCSSSATLLAAYESISVWGRSLPL